MGSHSNAKLKTDPVAEVLDSIRRIVRVLRIGSRAAEKQVGISGAQLFVLRSLKAGPGQSLNELAGRTRTHQSSVSVVVQRLVDRGLVDRTRSNGDARRLELSVTPAGFELLRHAPDAAQDRLINALESMSSRDQTQLAGLLSKLVTEMGAGDESVEMFFEETAGKRASKKCRV